jgi:hypothetical protein
MQASVIISSALLEWFCVEYAKKRDITINGDFKVWKEYRKEKENAGVNNFDIFARAGAIMIGDSRMSSGKANFLKWAFDNGVIDYVRNNKDEISQDMDDSKLEKVHEVINKKDKSYA